MEPLHRRIAEVALRAAEPYGFCLAGGYAVQEHGLVSRRSDDVDLFTTAAAQPDFAAAVDAVARALAGDGLTVAVTRRADTFARLVVGDPVSGAGANLDLGVDWRAHPPARLAVGPVLHVDDAVANKVCALFSRAAVRDYVDVHGILASGRYTSDDLMRISADHDPGFDRTMFVAGAARGRPVAGRGVHGLRPRPDRRGGVAPRDAAVGRRAGRIRVAVPAGGSGAAKPAGLSVGRQAGRAVSRAG